MNPSPPVSSLRGIEQFLTEALVQWVKKDVLHWQGVLVFSIQLPAALCLAYQDPIGGLIAGSPISGVMAASTSLLKSWIVASGGPPPASSSLS